MKANELMIGDWVQVRRKTGEWINCRCQREDFDWIDEEAEKRISYIPLTEEFLWKYCESPSIVEWYPNKKQPAYHVHIEHGDFIIDGTIRFVHELQHALRLCGLNNLADNFEV